MKVKELQEILDGIISRGGEDMEIFVDDCNLEIICSVDGFYEWSEMRECNHIHLLIDTSRYISG